MEDQAGSIGARRPAAIQRRRKAVAGEGPDEAGGPESMAGNPESSSHPVGRGSRQGRERAGRVPKRGFPRASRSPVLKRRRDPRATRGRDPCPAPAARTHCTGSSLRRGFSESMTAGSSYESPITRQTIYDPHCHRETVKPLARCVLSPFACVRMLCAPVPKGLIGSARSATLRRIQGGRPWRFP